MTTSPYRSRKPGIQPSLSAPRTATPGSSANRSRFGPRVECLVVSPYAKPGHIAHPDNSDVSLSNLCEDTFGLDPAHPAP